MYGRYWILIIGLDDFSDYVFVDVIWLIRSASFFFFRIFGFGERFEGIL